MRFLAQQLSVVLFLAPWTGCAAEIDDLAVTGGQTITWEEFRASVHETEHGFFIFDGDIMVEHEKELREYYERFVDVEEQALTVNLAGGRDDIWSPERAANLTYCVSRQSAGSRYNTIVAAMREAAESWEAVAAVDFQHQVALDDNCTPATNVTFDVQAVNERDRYLARAFFPSNSRSSRNVWINAPAFEPSGSPVTLEGILRHELGHALGFRHEHIRVEANPDETGCGEGRFPFRGVTAYDQRSVMHYPHCNGVNGRDLTITDLDAQGAATLYGPPGDEDPGAEDPGGEDPGGEDPGGEDPVDEPADDPEPREPREPPGSDEPATGGASGQLRAGQFVRFQPIDAAVGTRFRVSMSGNGDPDLYVSDGRDVSQRRFTCRSWSSSADEFCEITVRRGPVYVGVAGYTASRFDLSATWTER